MAFFGIGIHVSPVLHGSSVKNTECCAPMSDINLSTISLIGAAFGRKVVASIADGIGINISVILIIGRTDSCRKRRQGYQSQTIGFNIAFSIIRIVIVNIANIIRISISLILVGQVVSSITDAIIIYASLVFLCYIGTVITY